MSGQFSEREIACLAGLVFRIAKAMLDQQVGVYFIGFVRQTQVFEEIGLVFSISRYFIRSRQAIATKRSLSYTRMLKKRKSVNMGRGSTK